MEPRKGTPNTHTPNPTSATTSAARNDNRASRKESRYSDRDMGEALGQVYVEKYFSPEEKQRALNMTVAIEQAMGKDIPFVIVSATIVSRGCIPVKRKPGTR